MNKEIQNTSGGTRAMGKNIVEQGGECPRGIVTVFSQVVKESRPLTKGDVRALREA